MISLEKWMILTNLQKLPNNVGKLGKIILATGIEWFPKVQKIAQSGHTGRYYLCALAKVCLNASTTMTQRDWERGGKGERDIEIEREEYRERGSKKR